MIFINPTEYKDAAATLQRAQEAGRNAVMLARRESNDGETVVLLCWFNYEPQAGPQLPFCVCVNNPNVVVGQADTLLAGLSLLEAKFAEIVAGDQIQTQLAAAEAPPAPPDDLITVWPAPSSPAVLIPLGLVMDRNGGHRQGPPPVEVRRG